MISVRYSITKEDYVNYYTYVMWDAPEKRSTKIKYHVRQLLINLIIVAILLYSDLFVYNRMYVYAYGGIVLLSALWQIFYSRSSIRSRATKVADDPDNSTMYLENQLDISEAGIALKNTMSQSFYSWQAFIKKEENNEYYFLFVNAIQAVILPKRIFKTADEKQQLEKLMAQHLSIDAEVGHLMEQ